MTERVLVVAAIGEALTGGALLLVPSAVTQLLFGATLVGIAAVVARLAGVALIGLGVACSPGREMNRQVLGMLTYGLLAMVYLIYAGLNGMAGILLWPAVAVHAGLSVLLVMTWRRRREAEAGKT